MNQSIRQPRAEANIQPIATSGEVTNFLRVLAEVPSNSFGIEAL
jgi:hypothetical protein